MKCSRQPKIFQLATLQLSKNEIEETLMNVHNVHSMTISYRSVILGDLRNLRELK